MPALDDPSGFFVGHLESVFVHGGTPIKNPHAENSAYGPKVELRPKLTLRS
jgi:hypothetical protein